MPPPAKDGNLNKTHGDDTSEGLFVFEGSLTHADEAPSIGAGTTRLRALAAW